VVAVLLTAGVHVPVMPLVDVSGNVRLLPLQIGAMVLNNGMMMGFTTTVIERDEAH
jgi:hypothetical protein